MTLASQASQHYQFNVSKKEDRLAWPELGLCYSFMPQKSVLFSSDMNLDSLLNF